MPLSFPYRIDRTGRTASPADEAAHVRELIEQVIFTAPGERVNRPTFGSGVHRLVFAPSNDEMAATAQQLVRGALQQWLSEWIEVQSVDLRADEATLEVTVAYVIRRTRELQVATFERGLVP
jgi:phage baseplate assembly protein W